MKICWTFLIASFLVSAADDPYAVQLFEKHCAECHQSAAGAEGRIPQIAVLKTMTPAAIVRTMETGLMKAQAAPLSADERQRLAGFLGTAVTVERKREEIVNSCPASVPSARLASESPAWASWGGNVANTRFQSAKDAGLDAQAVPGLTLKWAFAFPDTSTLRSQPAVYRGRVYVGGQDGGLYALEAATGAKCLSRLIASQPSRTQ